MYKYMRTHLPLGLARDSCSLSRRLTVNQLLFPQGSWVDRNVQLGRDASLQLIARAYAAQCFLDAH